MEETIKKYQKDIDAEYQKLKTGSNYVFCVMFAGLGIQFFANYIEESGLFLIGFVIFLLAFFADVFYFMPKRNRIIGRLEALLHLLENE